MGRTCDSSKTYIVFKLWTFTDICTEHMSGYCLDSSEAVDSSSNPLKQLFSDTQKKSFWSLEIWSEYWTFSIIKFFQSFSKSLSNKLAICVYGVCINIISNINLCVPQQNYMIGGKFSIDIVEVYTSFN